MTTRTDDAAATKPLFIPDHTRSLCRSRLSAALRSALACTFVGVATLYAPVPLRRHLKFPAFSYVTAMLIAADSATFGAALRGAALALYGTALGLLPALMSFYIIRPEGFSATTTAMAVAISSFVVAISDSTGLIATRVALGQIVIVYVTAFKQARDHGVSSTARPELHPVPVAASTAVGAVASVLALVLPWPKLACNEVKEKNKLYTEITMERLRLFVSAFCADNSSFMAAAISRAKYLTGTCNKILQSIKLMQGGIQWERPPLKFLPPHKRISFERLQAIETSLKGMEIALSSTSSPPMIKTSAQDQHIQEKMANIMREQMSIKLARENNFNLKNQNDHTSIDKTLESLHVTIPRTLQDLPALFFLFCMKLLFDETLISAPPQISPQESKVTPTTLTDDIDGINSSKQEEKRKMKSIWPMNLSTEKAVIALKCSLSLGLAVFFGILFSEDNGYWSGLLVAIAFTPYREATFRLASVRANGTALGSVYGVLGSFISQHLMEVRLLALIPWVFFTSFIHRSRMYGQVGATAAAITAMIILGRRNYGSPMIFSIQRLTETYIGLCCLIFVELLLQPTRSSTMARSRLAESLQMLDKCIESVKSSAELKENEKKLRKRVNELKKYVEEAELEPNFWFLPFPVACYNKLHGSLAKMGDFLVFLAHAMEMLRKESPCESEEGSMTRDLEQVKKLVGASLRCLEEVMQVKSRGLEKDKNGCGNDIEVGRGQGPWANWALSEMGCERLLDSLLQRSRVVVERVDVDEGVGLKSQLVLCFASIGFCVGGLLREMREVEKGIVELVQWENPSIHVDLHEITCKIKDVST